MSIVFLDTCALLWWTLDPDKLSSKAKKAIAKEESPKVISSISIWEVGIKVKKGRLDLGLPFEEYVKRLQKVEGLKIVPVDETIWVENIALDWNNPDPADRTIVATAKRLRLPIITKDKEMIAFYPKIIW